MLGNLIRNTYTIYFIILLIKTDTDSTTHYDIVPISGFIVNEICHTSFSNWQDSIKYIPSRSLRFLSVYIFCLTGLNTNCMSSTRTRLLRLFKCLYAAKQVWIQTVYVFYKNSRLLRFFKCLYSAYRSEYKPCMSSTRTVHNSGIGLQYSCLRVIFVKFICHNIINFNLI